MNLEQGGNSVNLMMLKDLRITLKMRLVEIKILTNLYNTQLNVIHHEKCPEWIIFEKFQNITYYIAEGGFSKIYTTEWSEGLYLKIKNGFNKYTKYNKYVLKSLNNSSEISTNEVKTHLQIYLYEVVHYIDYEADIHNAGFIHKANKQTVKEEGIYGVLPYIAQKILCGYQYTKAADIYSFGIIIMNEFLSKEIPFNDIPHDVLLLIEFLNIKYVTTISKDVPKLLADLIIKCWDAEIENRTVHKT
ncbi:kinase-like domain-containing protein [Rhizophagus irregularis DAOM 181602=DAOM 197198]|nr:kinase-like domain-containing protein [Rhizophagus irregularis DAOM 181602=DAOM 197198]